MTIILRLVYGKLACLKETKKKPGKVPDIFTTIQLTKSF